MKPITSIDDPRYVKAMSHPLRVRILAMLDERTASPVELAGWLGSSLGTVAYHVRTLERMGLVELVRETRVRGAVEHHYRSCGRPQVSDEAWAAAPAIAKQAAVSASLQTIDAYARAASAAGGFDHGNSHLTRTQLTPRRPRVERAVARVHPVARPGRPHRGVRQGAHRAQPAHRRHQGRRAGDDAVRGRAPRGPRTTATRSWSAAGATAARSVPRSPTERAGHWVVARERRRAPTIAR